MIFIYSFPPSANLTLSIFLQIFAFHFFSLASILFRGNLAKLLSPRLNPNKNAYITHPFEKRNEFLLDRSKIGKHIVGHSRIYSFSNAEDSRHTQTMPPNAEVRSSFSTEKTQSAPTNMFDSTAIPCPLDQVPQLPDTAIHPPSIELETGNEVQPRKTHWWSRKKKGLRGHSLATSRAHEKTPSKLFKEIIFSSWINLLLVFIPVGIALHFANVSPTVVFIMNFLAIVPMAGVWFLWLASLTPCDELFFLFSVNYGKLTLPSYLVSPRRRLQSNPWWIDERDFWYFHPPFHKG